MVVQPRNVLERRREEFAALMRQELKVGRAWVQKKRRYVYPATGWKFWKGGTAGRRTAGGTDSQGGRDGLHAHSQHRDLLPASGDECDE